MSDIDAFTGRPTEPTREPRFWGEGAAAKWHQEASRRAATIAGLVCDIQAATDPVTRHSLECRLATLTGVPPSEYVEPAPAPAPTHDPEADRAAQRYLAKARRRQGRD